MNIVLCESSEFSSDGSLVLTDTRAVHLRRVLKVAEGSLVRIGVIDGPLGVGTVTAVDERSVTLRWVLEDAVPARPRVDLLLALPRPKVMRRLWAPLAAMGVGQVILTNAEKVERDYFDSHILAPEGYRPLLLEGLQQAKDTRLPKVSIHKQFRKLVESDLDGLFPDGRRLVAHPGAGAKTIAEAVSGSPEGGGSPEGLPYVLLAVGPEGGWNDFELALLAKHGFEPVSMGPRTLATTTACIALLALVHAALDVTR